MSNKERLFFFSVCKNVLLRLALINNNPLFALRWKNLCIVMHVLQTPEEPYYWLESKRKTVCRIHLLVTSSTNVFTVQDAVQWL